MTGMPTPAQGASDIDAYPHMAKLAIQMPKLNNHTRKPVIAASMDRLIWAVGVVLSSTSNLSAQGLPVDMGSKIPVGLWFVGAIVLGLVIAWGILHNRRRTRAEKQRTEQATRENYRQEDRNRNDRR